MLVLKIYDMQKINQTQIWYVFKAKNFPKTTQIFNVNYVLIALTKINLSLEYILLCKRGLSFL